MNWLIINLVIIKMVWNRRINTDSKLSTLNTLTGVK